MAKQNRTTLKGYFETGDIPTGGNYVDLIDSPIILDIANTGSLNLQGTGSFEGGIDCIGDGKNTTGSFGYISASGDISTSGNLIGAKIVTNIITDYAGTNTITDDGTDITIENRGFTAEGQITANSFSNITVLGNVSASGFISGEGNSVLKGLPTTETSITGALWLSGSSASGTSKYLMVFTG